MSARCTLLRVLLPALAGTVAARADVVIENAQARLVFTNSAQCTSLVQKTTGRDLCSPQGALPTATVTLAGRTHASSGAALEGDRLTLRFDGTDTTLVYQVAPSPRWIRFRLTSVAGPRPEQATLLQLPVALTQNVGPRLNIAWDERTAVCLMAANRQVDCGATRQASAGRPYALLRATTQDRPGPPLEGAEVALIVAPTPSIRPVLQQAAQTFGLLTNAGPDGKPSKETEDARGAYWFLTLGQNDADRAIDYCRLSGIRQVLLSFGSWCASAGHYTFNKGAFPDGETGLKRLVDRLHQAGIKVGMHTFVSKVSKTDPYVTPKPDRRFWVDRRSVLAEPLTPGQTEIRCAGDLREWPGSPIASQKVWEGGVDKHCEVVLDDEIVQYRSIGPEGRWDTLLGCKRGAWGTTPSAHARGTEVRHYGVDGCINGYIIDQETSLMDEVADRIAGIFNRCGFDMVYFDGGEDVDRTRFHYYVSNFQEQAMRRFRKRPIIHMGTIMTHLLWHSFTRSATVDTYLNTLYGAIAAGQSVDRWPTVREHVDRSVDYMLSVRQDLMPGELGWFGIWGKGPNTDGLQLDEFEYLMAKSLAYDAPVSLQTSFAQMESHPLTPGILELFRVYDGLRMRRAVDEHTRRMLAQKGQDFALVKTSKGIRFIRVSPVETIAGGRDVRACVGEMDGQAVATFWHAFGTGEVVLGVPLPQVRAADLEGRPLRLRAEGLRTVVPAGSRRITLFFPGRTAAQTRVLLATAQVRARPATVIRIEAESYTRISGNMAKGSSRGIHEPEASGDVIVPTATPDRADPPAWYCEYRVQVPHAGRWTLWARVRYPSGADDSFAVVLPGQPVTLALDQAIGNCGAHGGRWHWTGRGGGIATPPPGEPVAFILPKGLFTFRIYAREGPADPERAPRLDQLCLTDGAGPPAE